MTKSAVKSVLCIELYHHNGWAKLCEATIEFGEDTLFP